MEPKQYAHYSSDIRLLVPVYYTYTKNQFRLATLKLTV